jgi:hypothetical protein
MEMETGIGYLGLNGTLYCAEPCVRTAGVTEGRFVEYESLVETGRAAAATLCPVCGAEFAIDWPERTRID